MSEYLSSGFILKVMKGQILNYMRDSHILQVLDFRPLTDNDLQITLSDGLHLTSSAIISKKLLTFEKFALILVKKFDCFWSPIGSRVIRLYEVQALPKVVGDKKIGLPIEITSEGAFQSFKDLHKEGLPTFDFIFWGDLERFAQNKNWPISSKVFSFSQLNQFVGLVRVGPHDAVAIGSTELEAIKRAYEVAKKQMEEILRMDQALALAASDPVYQNYVEKPSERETTVVSKKNICYSELFYRLKAKFSNPICLIYTFASKTGFSRPEFHKFAQSRRMKLSVFGTDFELRIISKVKLEKARLFKEAVTWLHEKGIVQMESGALVPHRPLKQKKKVPQHATWSQMPERQNASVSKKNSQSKDEKSPEDALGYERRQKFTDEKTAKLRDRFMFDKILNQVGNTTIESHDQVIPSSTENPGNTVKAGTVSTKVEPMIKEPKSNKHPDTIAIKKEPVVEESSRSKGEKRPKKTTENNNNNVIVMKEPVNIKIEPDIVIKQEKD